MAISSLPKENKANLIELSADLEDVLSEKESVIEEASKLIDKMKLIDETQNKLDEKGSKIVDIETPKDAREFQELLEKADELSTEKSDIYNESKIINKRLNELNNVEKSLKEEISRLLKSENNKISDGINIVDRKVPTNIDKIDKDSTKIINSSLTLSNYITDLSNNYIENRDIISFDADYNQLKEKVEEYETIKKDSSEELKLVEKEQSVVKEEKPVIDTNINVDNESVLQEEIEKPIINNEVQEEVSTNVPLEENPTEIKNSEVIESKEETQKPVMDANIVVDPLEKQMQELSINQPKEENIIPLSSVIENNSAPVENNLKVVKFNEKVVQNKIARATKKKIREVILPKFSGTYEERKVISSFSSSENQAKEEFNLENFINNKTA